MLTARDRELLVHLAMARHLSGEQIRKLMFSGKADSISRRRLSSLVSGKFPYIRRLPFRRKDGRPVVAWSLAPLGYMAARNFFAGIRQRAGADAPGAEFLEHQVRLNDLYIALAVAELSRRGVKFSSKPHLIARMDDHDLYMAFFNDPDGHTLAVCRRHPRATFRPRRS